MATNPATLSRSRIAEQNSGQKIEALITEVSKFYGSAREKVQEAGLAIMKHAEDYGDCSRAVKLARAVPARERNSLIGWFMRFSPIGVTVAKEAKDDKARFRSKDAKNYSDFQLLQAKSTNWWDDPMKVNPEPKPLNTLSTYYESLDKLLKRWIADAEKDDKVHPDQREEVKNQARELMVIINRYHAKHLVAETPAPETGDHEDAEEGAGAPQAPAAKRQGRRSKAAMH